MDMSDIKADSRCKEGQIKIRSLDSGEIQWFPVELFRPVKEL